MERSTGRSKLSVTHESPQVADTHIRQLVLLIFIPPIVTADDDRFELYSPYNLVSFSMEIWFHVKVGRITMAEATRQKSVSPDAKALTATPIWFQA